MAIERRVTRIQFLGTPISGGWESKEERTAEIGGASREKRGKSGEWGVLGNGQPVKYC